MAHASISGLCDAGAVQPRAPRRRLSWKLFLLFPAPFVLLMTFVFVLDWLENRGHVWTAIEREPVFGYGPAGAHLVASSHSGWAFAARCSESSRCEYTHTFASPLSEDALRAQVERDLAALGFTRTPPHAGKCAPAYAHAERFARGDISVWPTYGTTPYRMGKSSTIASSEGASIVQLRIDNMEVVWGC